MIKKAEKTDADDLKTPGSRSKKSSTSCATGSSCGHTEHCQKGSRLHSCQNGFTAPLYKWRSCIAIRWRHSCFAREPFWPVAADTPQRLSIHERTPLPSPSLSLCCIANQLGLSGDQIKQLTAIQEKSNADAKAVLTDEQRIKLGTVTKGWKPMSMDHCWDLDEPISHSVAPQAVRTVLPLVSVGERRRVCI